MTDLRGRTFSDLVAGLNAGQHLAVDAVVAFVDGELAAGPRDRAAQHLTNCQTCAAEVAAQRQARSVVRSAECPSVPAGLLAALRDIPLTTDLPPSPEGLSMTEDGCLVAVADPARAPVGSTAPLGAGPRWGNGSLTLGRRIGLTGAGMVMSGLVLGALFMTMLEDPVTGTAVPQPEEPTPASVPSFIPALATLPKLDVGAAGNGALHMTDQPGWHVLRMPR
ncbi:MAG TPA: hypothetical protein VHH34_07970 [Pseudonocardiaceae bacterium]|nr:hypothetical protein [Pseudonocardiaceae bacterium]